MVKIINDEDGVEITIQSRNRFGQDGEAVTVAAGKSAEIAGDHENQVVISFAKEDQSAPMSAPATAVLEQEEAEEVELVDPTDDDIRAAGAAIDARPDVASHKTNAGAYRVGGLNEELAAKGFKPINADTRDRIWPPAQ